MAAAALMMHALPVAAAAAAPASLPLTPSRPLPTFRVDDISVVVTDIDFTRPLAAGFGSSGADGEDCAVLFAF